MLPTYTFSEVKNFIRSLDIADVAILNGLIEEEIECYARYESKAIFKLIMLHKKAIAQNEVRFEFLLAYN